jgi:ferredoxin
MSCGVCVAKCAQKALSLAREPNKGQPLEIRKLIAQAAGTTGD